MRREACLLFGAVRKKAGISMSGRRLRHLLDLSSDSERELRGQSKKTVAIGEGAHEKKNSKRNIRGVFPGAGVE